MNLPGEYIVKQIAAAQQLLDDYTPSADRELLHQLRVALKKVKAVIELLQAVHPGKHKKLKHLLKQLFSNAGVIREMQLRVSWLQKHRCTAIIEATLLQTKLTEEEELFAAQKSDWQKSLGKLKTKLKKQTASIDQQQILNYTSALKETIVKERSSVTTADWHLYRKQLKQLLYTQHWLKEGDRLKLLPVQTCKRLDRLQDTIGLWHDAEERLQKMEQELLYLHPDEKVRRQFARCRLQLQQEIFQHEKAAKRMMIRS